MRVALLVAIFVLAALAQSESACKRRVASFVFEGDGFTAAEARVAW
jgi:hypothetical protein